MASVQEKIVSLEQQLGDELPDVEGEAWERANAQEILTAAIKKYQSRLALSASFGAPEGMVLLDMMHRIDPASRVFVLDTGRLHPGMRVPPTSAV